MRKIYLNVVRAMLTLFTIGGVGFSSFGQISYTQGWEDPGLNSWVDGGTNGTFSRSTTTPCVGAASVRANNYFGGTSTLRSPALTGTDGEDLTVTFLYKVTDYNNNSVGAPLANLDNIELQWATSTSGPWTTVYTINSSNHIVSATCASVSTTFSGLPTSGDVYIRFAATAAPSPADNYVYFDDIVIYQGAPPACLSPSALTLSGVTSNTADISWTAGNSETDWNIEWGAPGFTPGTGDEIGAQTASGTPNTSVLGLLQNTSYHIYVQADCGVDGTSTWTGPISVTTLQTAVAIPYTDDFSSNNWALGNGSETNQWFVGAAEGNPANSLYVTNDGGGTNAYSHTTSTVHASKVFTLPAGSNPFNVAFQWKAGGESTWDYMRVWVIPATATPTPGTLITTANIPGALRISPENVNLQSSWQNANYEIPASFAGADVKVVFEWRNDGGGGIQPAVAVDNFSLTEITCPNPTALTLSSLTSTSADIFWTAGDSETSWNVSWGAVGYTPGDVNEIGTSTVSVTNEEITGLAAETSYHVYVQADCDVDGTSTWTGPLVVYTGYCTPVYTLGDYTSAFATTGAYTNVTFSASSSFNYQNLSAGDPITYIAGEDINFTHSYDGGSNTLRIWVDWNNDLTFDSSEEVYQNYTSGANQSGSITIPSGTPNGSYRMRIRSRFSTTVPGPCSSETYGSALDYTIVVVDEIVSPSITQSSVTPDCTNGTELSTSGTPGADEGWYWQTTASGTSTANDATTPWTVFENGTYYVRAYHSVYDVWSEAESIVITNVPTAPAPPTPAAAQNPACDPGTEISVGAAPAGVEYYWQGTSSTSSSTSDPASAPYQVTATGTYYVKAFETATGCWSEPEGITVTVDSYIPEAPIVVADVFNICSGATSQLIEANAFAYSDLTVVVGTDLINAGSLTVPFTVPALPVGAVVTSAELQLFNVNAINGSWRSEIRVGLSGDYTLAATQISTLNSGGLVSPDPVINLAGFPSTGGSLNLLLTETFDDSFADPSVIDATFGEVRLVINYSYLLPISWYDAATAGTIIGTGSPFEAVGAGTLTNPATNGSYEFYAEGVSGACVSASRTLVTVNVNDVNVDLDINDATCNNGNDGSFTVSYVHCGFPPFEYSIDGSAFSSNSSGLTAGTYTVIVRDVNGDESNEYTIVIGSAPAPSDVEVISYSNEEATIVWNSNGSETEWNIEWGAPGFTPGTGTEIGSGSATDTTFTITGLDGSTEYDVYVSANCGAGTTTGDWDGTDVLTDCDPIPAVGYCEDFEDVDLLDCWRIINANGDGDVWGVYTGYANSGNQSAGLYTDYNAGNNDDYLVMPRMTLTGNEVLTFHYRARSANEPNDFRVVLSTTGFEAADFTTEILPLMTVSNTTYQDTSINLSAYSGDVFIAFHVPPGGLDGWYLYIDDVCVDICTPNPGTDGSVDVCRLDGTVDLNTVITSEYAHGTWSFPANPGVVNGSEFNVSTLANDTYEVLYIVTTACTADTTIATINVYNPSSAGTNGLITACMNQPIDLMGGLNGNVDFGGTWYNASGIALSGSYFVTGTLIGQAVYTYVVSNGVCGADTSEVIVNIQNCDWLGLEDLTLLDNVTVAPNPNTGNFQIIGTPGADYTYEVLDLNGRVVRSTRKITSTITDVNLTDVENGVYMVRIAGNDSERMIRVIKQN